MTGRPPNMSEKLASTLLYWLEAMGAPIPHDHAKLMSTDQILSLFDFDHWPIRRADGGTNHPTNIRPLFKLAHREKTAKKDAPEMAKDRDIAKAEARHRESMAAKASTFASFAELEAAAAKVPIGTPIKIRMPAEFSVRDPQRSRPRSRLRSKGFDKRVTKGFDGKVRERKPRRVRT